MDPDGWRWPLLGQMGMGALGTPPGGHGHVSPFPLPLHQTKVVPFSLTSQKQKGLAHELRMLRGFRQLP